MTAPSTAAIIAASADPDLRARIAAAAAEHGLQDNAEAWAHVAAMRVVSQPVDADGTTLAGLYDYAVSQYAPPPPPGKGPARVRDDQIRAAIRAVLSPAG